MTQTGRRLPWWVPVALALGGAALLAVPYLPRSGSAPMPLPASLGAGAPMPAAAMALFDALDGACRQGDLQAFRSLVTPGYLRRLEQKLLWIGRRLDGPSLRSVAGPEGAAGLAQELHARPFLGCSSRAESAVLLFDLGDLRSDAGYPVRCGLKAVVLQWDGARLRLHTVQEQPLDAGADRKAAAAEICRRWLGD
jgi:hypothetical protein